MRIARSLLLSSLLLGSLAQAQDADPVSTLPMGAQNSVSFNMLNFVSLAAGAITLDVNYTRTLSPTLALHLNPAGTFFGGQLGVGAEAGLRFFPFLGALNGFWVGGKVGANYSDITVLNATRLVTAGGSAQFQLGYTFVFSPAGNTSGALARDGFLLELGGSLGAGYFQVNNLAGVTPAFGLRMAIGYAF